MYLNCRYCTLVMHVKKLANKIKELDPKDPFRVECSAALLEKLYNLVFI
jgi:U3 small nucleolar ribonucleoprotein protein IMP3